jgi:hypothetical protein
MNFNTRSLLYVLFVAVIATVVLGLSSAPAYADDESCSAVITNLDQAIAACDDLNSNWACYASTLAEAAPVKYRFHNPRDRRPLAVLDEIRTRDEDAVVVLNLQPADQKSPITAVLAGRVDLEADDADLGVYSVHVEGDRLLCQGAPPGMAIRTRSGETGRIVLNGVQVELRSVAYVTFGPNSRMIIVNVEGRVTVTAGGQTQALAAGEQVQADVGGSTSRLVGTPVMSPLADSMVVQWLANEGLPRIQNTNESPKACVGTIDFGSPITVQNFDPGQECLYRFCASAGNKVTIEMRAVDPTLDPWLDIRAPDGSMLQFNNDTGGDNRNSIICNLPLTETSCDYTIVARSAYNVSAGSFSLRLDKDTTCTPPEPRCEVVTPLGTNLFTGPGWNYDPIRVLQPATHLRPLESSRDRRWLHVEVERTAQNGWIFVDDRNFECEQPLEQPSAVLTDCPDLGLPCGDMPVQPVSSTSSAALPVKPRAEAIAGVGGILTFGFMFAAAIAFSALVVIDGRRPDDPEA